MNVYYRTDRAAVDQPAQSHNNASGAPSERTVWAKVPLHTRHGRCVALKQRGDQLLVGVAGAPSVQWFAADRVLSELQFQEWLKTGFA